MIAMRKAKISYTFFGTASIPYRQFIAEAQPPLSGGLHGCYGLSAPKILKENSLDKIPAGL
jgi:hypothetical protein